MSYKILLLKKKISNILVLKKYNHFDVGSFCTKNVGGLVLFKQYLNGSTLLFFDSIISFLSFCLGPFLFLP